MSLHPRHLRECVIEPALRGARMYSPAAVRLLLGTAAVESRLRFLSQVGGGPALGIYQMEPATARDITGRYFTKRQDVAARVSDALRPFGPGPLEWAHVGDDALKFRLAADLAFGTLLARVRYFYVSAPLPAADDLDGLAAYWKRHYNTLGGAGTERKFIDAYTDLIAPAL